MEKLELPDLLKHMTLQIFLKGYVRGPKEHRLKESFNIARGQLAEWGYLTAGSATGGFDDIKLTGKGAARNNKHRTESGGKAKSAMFDALFAPLMAASAEKKTQDSSTLPAGKEGRTMRQDQRDTNVAKSALGAPKLGKNTKTPQHVRVAKNRKRR